VDKRRPSLGEESNGRPAAEELISRCGGLLIIIKNSVTEIIFKQIRLVDDSSRKV
jgi:hypothetical protein